MNKKDYIIPAFALLCVLALLLHAPIPQDQGYHQFADQRTFFGIPNFLNVITNLPFLFIAVMGLRTGIHIKEQKLRYIFLSLFTGFFLLTFGSGYYHWLPNNTTLVFDRLPMVIIFMSFFAFVIYQCIGQAEGYIAFIALNIAGILTVIYWIFTEQNGNGDLRGYGMVQFFPIIAIPLYLILYKPLFPSWKDIFPVFIFFILAKLAEQFDKQIYHILYNTISGHSLKHIFVAGAEYEIVIMIRRQIKGIS